MPGVVPVESFLCEGTTLVQFGGVHCCDVYFGSLPDFLDRGASGKKKYFVLPYLPPRSDASPSIVIVDV